MWRMLSVIACFGFWFFLPNTQHRIGPLGISEFFGVLAIVVFALSAHMRITVEVAAAASLHGVLTMFTLFAVASSLSDLSAESRDVVAVTYSIVVSIAVVNLMTTAAAALRASVIAMALCICLYLSLLLFAVLGGGSTSLWLLEPDDLSPSIDVFSESFPALPRFIGLSENPNQLALYVLFCFLFFLASRRAVEVKRWSGVVAGLSIACVVLMFSTQSDAGLLALASGLALYALVAALRKGGASAVLIAYIAIATVGWLISYAWKWGVGDDAGGQRLPLWISAIGIIDDARGLGLGYGSHIPTERGLYEAHSLPIDLALFGGALGIAFYVAAVLRYVNEALFGKTYLVSVLALTVLVFCLTYSPMRNPVFWMAMFLPFYPFAGLCGSNRSGAR
jgi:hypothetical protein